MAIHHGKPYMRDIVHLSCVFLCLGFAGYQIDAHSGLYADNSARQQTVLIDSLPSRQRREIQKEILTLLGLDHKPKPITHVKKNSAPKYMLDLYHSLEGDDEYSGQHFPQHNLSMGGLEGGVDGADMIMSFVNRAGKAARAEELGTKNLFYFDFSEVPATRTVTGAELRIFKKPVRKLEDRQPINIQLYRFIHSRVGGLDYILEPEVNISVPADEKGWLHFNVVQAATQWTYFPAENLGLYLKITDKYGEELTPHEAGLVGRRGPEDRQSFMVAFFQANQQLHVRRTRAAKREAAGRQHSRRGGRRGVTRYERSYDQSYNSQPPSRCAKRALYVNFKDLGWQDWIIAPEGYAAFYCHGECQFPLHAYMNASNHAIVQALVRVSRTTKEIPMPCCAPTKLSAKSVLYFDDNSNVILKKYRNMVVKACGCH